MHRVRSVSRRQILSQAVEGLEARRLFATFTVTNVADSGAGSLRDAITQSNADEDADVIAFNIPGDGVHTIRPLTPLPDIVNKVDIDGYTQPGAKPNTLAVGDDRTLLIELSGATLLTSGAGLHFTENGPGRNSGGSSVRGLVINSNFSDGVRINSGGTYGLADITVAGNFFGTNAAGNAFASYMPTAVDVSGFQCSDNHVGGPSPADRNVMAGSSQHISLSGTSDNVIENNYIGLSADGMTPIAGSGSSGTGVLISNSASNTIGGTTAASRNVIVTGTGGVSLSESVRNRIIGNYIGVAADGVTTPAGSTASIFGIALSNTSTLNAIGGNSAAEGNVIANADSGILALTSNVIGVVIRHNSIFATGQPIKLAGIGSDVNDINDLNDVDSGANHGQNFAALVSAVATAGGTKVNAFLNTQSNRGYVVDFFASPSTGNPAKPQAKTWLGSTQVTTDDNGNVSFTADLPAVAPGTYLTNTVTALATYPFGDTSQVSAVAVVEGVVAPPPPVELPTIGVGDVSVTEGNSGTKTLTFTVKLSAAATTGVSVLYATQDGTAKTSDNDYAAKSGTLTFAAGETIKTVSVTIKGDAKYEIDESLKLLLSSATGATIGDGFAVGTIKNDDATPKPPKLSVGGFTTTEGHTGTRAFTFKVTLDKSSTGPITVKYGTLDDSAKAGSDYTAVTGTLTFAAGETSKTVTVYVKGDKTKEGDEKFYLTLTSPTNATIAVGKGTGLIKNDD